MSYNFTPNGGEPWGTCCKQCKLPIFPDQQSEEVHFPPDSEGAEMSGTYHAQCAQPFAGLARALKILRRWQF